MPYYKVGVIAVNHPQCGQILAADYEDLYKIIRPYRGDDNSIIIEIDDDGSVPENSTQVDKNDDVVKTRSKWEKRIKKDKNHWLKNEEIESGDT